VKQRNVNEIGM